MKYHQQIFQWHDQSKQWCWISCTKLQKSAGIFQDNILSCFIHNCYVQARLETTMRSFPSSAEVAREAELEKQELAMKRKRSAHEVRIICISNSSTLCDMMYFCCVTRRTQTPQTTQKRNLLGWRRCQCWLWWCSTEGKVWDKWARHDETRLLVSPLDYYLDLLLIICQTQPKYQQIVRRLCCPAMMSLCREAKKCPHCKKTFFFFKRALLFADKRWILLAEKSSYSLVQICSQ